MNKILKTVLEESRKGNENTRAISVSFDLYAIFETQDKTVKKDRITVFAGAFFKLRLRFTVAT